MMKQWDEVSKEEQTITLEGQSATFRVPGLVFFVLYSRNLFWPQLLHDFLQHFL